MIKIDKTCAEMSFLLYGIYNPIAFNRCFLDFSRYYNNIVIFLNNPGLYFNDNRLTKISFTVISNEIVHTLLLLGPDFEKFRFPKIVFQRSKIIKTILRGPKLKFCKLRYFGI